MGTLNSVTLIGNLGTDPKIHNSDNGSKIANVSLATQESFTDKSGQKIENTDWHNITAFGSKAELIEKYLKKGDSVCVSGKLKTRSYEDKEGKTRFVTEVIVGNIIFLTKKEK